MELEEYLERVRLVEEDAGELADDISAGLEDEVTGKALEVLLKRGRKKISDYQELLSTVDKNRIDQTKESLAYPIERVEKKLKKLEEWAKSNGNS